MQPNFVLATTFTLEWEQLRSLKMEEQKRKIHMRSQRFFEKNSAKLVNRKISIEKDQQDCNNCYELCSWAIKNGRQKQIKQKCAALHINEINCKKNKIWGRIKPLTFWGNTKAENKAEITICHIINLDWYFLEWGEHINCGKNEKKIFRILC